MSDIPFTRKDLLALMSGTADEQTKPIHKFREAWADIVKTVESSEGLAVTEKDLESVFMHYEGDFWFNVPRYFYDACQDCREQGEKLRVFGLRIEPWDKEFIAAHYDMSRLIPALKRAGVGPLEPQSPKGKAAKNG